MTEPLPVASPLSGALWTWFVPLLLFAIACGATWMLYRHFADRNDEGEDR